MNSIILDFLRKRLAYVLLGALLAAPQLAAAALSISQVPLFITISMPPNITVLLDDSGSMQWAHVPDWLGSGGTGTILVTNISATATTPTTTVISTPVNTGTITSTPHNTSGSVIVSNGAINNGSVTSTSSPIPGTVNVVNGSVNNGTVTVVSSPISGTVSSTPGAVNTESVTSTCTKTSHGVCTTYSYSCAGSFTLNGPTGGSTVATISTTCTQQTYNYSCASGFTLSGSSTGTTSTAPSGTTCSKANYNYSCASGYTLNGPASGSSSTGSGTTCTQQTYNYSCASGYTLTGPTSGTSSTGSGDSCAKPNYNYSCASGYTLSGPTSGSTTATSSTTCTQQTYNYSCSAGYTLGGSSTGTTSTAPSGTTCTQTTYTYSCSSGYVLIGSSTGTTSTAPSGTTCTKYTYSCPTGYTLNGSATGTTSTAPSSTTCQGAVVYNCPTGDTVTGGTGSSTTCSGYETFTATINVANDNSSGGVYAPDTNHYKCACYNPLSYDPTITYQAGYNDTGTALSTSFTAAYVNPYVTSQGTVNLATSYEATVDYNPSTTASTLMAATAHGALGNVNDEINSCNGSFTYSGSGFPTCASVHNPQAAFYYVYDANNTNCSGVVTDDRCMDKVVVSSTSGPNNTDERQNFANWFSFYRTRNLTTNTSANIAFTGLNSNYRVAWRDLNTCSAFNTTSCKGWNSTIYDNRIAAFSGTHRQTFFDWLQHYPANSGTPLRSGLQSIGAYYQTTGTNSPYAFNPQVTDSPEYVCRPNYAVIMTDGLWNDSSNPSPAVNNADGTAATLPDGTAFPTKTYPYYDSYSSSMADVAFYYWATNLRSDLGLSTSLQYMPYTKNVSITDTSGNTANMIPYWNPQNDPASWPHMVTFTIGLGLTSTITKPAWGGSTYAGQYSNLVTGNIAWPQTSSNSANNVYDLWHSAIDSRGQFFAADTPQDVQQAFNTIVNRIQGRVGSSSAIAVNSTRLDSNTFIYQAQFNSSNWTGEVMAFSINSNGSVNSQPTWQASANIPAPSSRNILTWDDTQNSGFGAGTTFQWSNLNTAEQTALNQNINLVADTNGSLRVNYLRGDQSEEQDQSGGIFRIRTSVLGDIVDSNPQYVGAQNYGFDSTALTEGSSYDSFIATKPNRTYPHMLYVGGNDGMLHGIDADNGKEIFDYVPRGVYPNLSAIPDPLYTHEFYVDGSPTSVDAYVSGAWKTLVVATTGAGAKEVFVLDVTDASSMTGSQVLWDYDGTDGKISGAAYTATGGSSTITLPDPNMGYTINEPTIVRMHDGDWYALFGNGYNSTNQQAVIYLYNLNTSRLYTYSTGTGSASVPNGMSSPSPVDYDGDRITDAIYAGDLLGNLWKLDVSGNNPASWKFTTYGNSVATPLFTAHDGTGNVQPITDRPQVGLNTSGQVMVFFGTGTYFLTGDNTVGSNPPVMSAYGIIDDLGNTAADQVKGVAQFSLGGGLDRSELLAQYVVTTDTVNGTLYRITTSYAMSSSNQGWYIDLLTPPTGTATVGTAQGERVVSDAVLDLGRIVFTTLIPQGNACQYGGESFLMELSESNGGALSSSPFDTNGDGLVNSQDMVTVTYYDPKSGKNVTATVAVSGQLSNVGIIKTPGIIASGQLQYKYYSGSTGAIGVTTEKGSDSSQRISWQQLQ